MVRKPGCHKDLETAITERQVTIRLHCMYPGSVRGRKSVASRSNFLTNASFLRHSRSQRRTDPLAEDQHQCNDVVQQNGLESAPSDRLRYFEFPPMLPPKRWRYSLLQQAKSSDSGVMLRTMLECFPRTLEACPQGMGHQHHLPHHSITG